MGDGFKDLDPVHQLRVRGVLRIAGIWAGFILVTAVSLIASKPYLDRKREEREKIPGHVPLMTRKPPKNDSSTKSRCQIIF